MLHAAVYLMGLTALGGLVMALQRFSGHARPPSWLAMVHGLLAASGLTLVIYTALTSGLPAAAWAGLGLLMIAALGGIYLNLAFHARQLPLSKGVVIVHGLLAVAGFALMALAVFP